MSTRGNTDTNNPLPMTEAEFQERLLQFIAQYEASRPGNKPPNGCTYKQFLGCQPLHFDGTGGAVAFVRWVEKTDTVLRASKCAPDDQVTYISGLFRDGALSWWKLQVQTMGEAVAYALSWDELKELMYKKYYSRTESQKVETEFWNLKMEGPKIAEYVEKFQVLSRIVPYMVDPEFKRIERFIWGLAPQIMSMVTTSKPATITEAINLSVALTEEAIRMNKFSTSEEKKETHVESSGDNKRKLANFKQGTQSSSNNKAKKRKEYMGKLPKCDRCRRHHTRRCKNGKCDNCGKVGHNRETCWREMKRGKKGKGKDKGCYNCGDMRHYRKDCPKEIRQNYGKDV
ncbi:putative transcription factor interactor and regulator CCHC(Zn) family [Helianthus annuus]|nr:putative transcription factor interactor and regulator CCHC(Zn) family [Helianthus annuus]